MTRVRGAAARLLMGCVVAISAGCAARAPAESAGSQPTDASDSGFRVIGYVPDTGVMASEEQLRQLTHINYAFALPRPDGTLFEIANPWKLEDYVATAHQHGIKILISVGGWAGMTSSSSWPPHLRPARRLSRR